jgi:hypothetical protein
VGLCQVYGGISQNSTKPAHVKKATRAVLADITANKTDLSNRPPGHSEQAHITVNRPLTA